MQSVIWVVLVLVPIAALFSGLSLALAAMARSSKEGQYYLMPLMLGTMPLMMLPMLPAMELDLGNSLIPVTGVILLLRSLIEGQYAEALRYSVPVISVTGMCCWLAGLWAINQFEDENVLFHESEQISLRSWIVHVFRDRADTPTVAQAFLCAVLLLMLRFFGSLMLPSAGDWNGLLLQNAIAQLGFIAGPAVAMAWLLTRKPTQTLLLQPPATFPSRLGSLVGRRRPSRCFLACQRDSNSVSRERTNPGEAGILSITAFRRSEHVVAAVNGRRAAGDLRGTGVSWFHFIRLASYEEHIAGCSGE